MTTYKIAPAVRLAIAKAMVEESDPGYNPSYMGRNYAVDTDADGVLDAVFFREAQAPWNPWRDDAVAVSVATLYENSTASFDPTVDADLFANENLNEEEIAQAAFDAAVALALEELA